MSTTSTTVQSRVLAKPVKVKPENGERLLKPGRGGQIHLIAQGETATVCGLDSTRWLKVEDVTEAGEITCPACAKRIASGQRISDAAKAAAAKTIEKELGAAQKGSGETTEPPATEVKADPKPSGRKRGAKASA